MTLTKYIFRSLFFLITVFLIVYINRKTDDNAQTIAEFKFETLKKLKADSLDSQDQVDVLINETKKFNDQVAEDSPIRKGFRYLTATLVLFVLFELSFWMIEKNKPNRQG
jgi:hypothetical protein